ncbi:hypothetical protein FACS1894121_0580 [Bacteroidia bacterium]|nr:hypothetical protein FACS1894121_0580 [Bacteroidia bacterium]
METMRGVQYEKDTLGRARCVMSDKRHRRVDSQVEQSPYNPEYVKMINEQEKLPGVKIKIEDLWK